jgi:luciferase family oxidoreductase group 1
MQRVTGRRRATGGVELTVLDLLPVVRGQTEGAAAADSLVLARRAEALGYARFWLAEHHNPGAPGLACPELVLPLAAAGTSTMRVGTAGILFRYYSPLKVAQSFRLLEALFPGRIDLGLARGRPPDALAEALADGRPVPTDAEGYRAKVVELVRFLRGGLTEGQPSLAKAPSSGPQLWLLGSNELSVRIAAEVGAAFCFALFLHPDIDLAERVIDHYRAAFRPSETLAEPHWSVAASGVCAPTTRQAERLLAAHQNRFLAERANVVGSPARCRALLEEFGRRLGTRRYVFLTLCSALDDRVRSHELLARAFRVQRPERTASGTPAA